MTIILSPTAGVMPGGVENGEPVSSESKRLGCMRGLGILGRDTDIKAIGREEIIAMFEGRE
jgi:hypothetical protein